MLKPFGATAIEALVNCLIHEAFKRLDIFPDGQIDGDPRIGIRPGAGGIAALVNIAPHKTWRPLGQTVHQREIVREVRHARIVDLETDAADIELRKMMIGGLLHHRYSAAWRTAPVSGLRKYSSMRRSISGRKWRSRPCTGQAAPSPKAQMV